MYLLPKCEIVSFKELEAIKARVKEMEEEAEKLKQMQKSVDEEMQMTSPTLAQPGRVIILSLLYMYYYDLYYQYRYSQVIICQSKIFSSVN